MAVRIRLQRKGARHMAFYRIVATDSRTPRDGRFIDQIGYYDPLKDPAIINVDTEKAIDWLGKGAKPSQTVRSLFSRVGIMQTWHEVRRGKSLDELRHIEEEARKRIEAQAAMRKRTKEEKKDKKEQKAAPAAEPEGSGEATESQPEPVEAAGESAADEAEPAAERPDEQAEEKVEPAAEPAPEEQREEAEEEKDAAPEVQEPEKADEGGGDGETKPEE